MPIYLPGMNGFDLLRRLTMRATAAGHHDHWRRRRFDGGSGHEGRRADFIEKPIGRDELLASVDAHSSSPDAGKLSAWREDAARHVAGLTPRQHQIMELVLAGHPSKNIAADLGISQRTVETIVPRS